MVGQQSESSPPTPRRKRPRGAAFGLQNQRGPRRRPEAILARCPQKRKRDVWAHEPNGVREDSYGDGDGDGDGDGGGDRDVSNETMRMAVA